MVMDYVVDQMVEHDWDQVTQSSSKAWKAETQRSRPRRQVGRSGIDLTLGNLAWLPGQARRFLAGAH